MTTYSLDSHIPPPDRIRRAGVDYAALPLNTMEIGQSFFVPRTDFGERSVHVIGGVIRNRARRMGRTVRTEVRHQDIHKEEGLRCWRMA